LGFVCADDRGNQSREALIDFQAARGVLHLDSSPFPADQTCLSQGFEMEREGGFGNGSFADLKKVRAIVGTVRPGDLGEDGHSDRVGEGMENAFHGNVFE
jgi:hypothetical protein